jgi:hypothetical protein
LVGLEAVSATEEDANGSSVQIVVSPACKENRHQQIFKNCGDLPSRLLPVDRRRYRAFREISSEVESRHRNCRGDVLMLPYEYARLIVRAERICSEEEYIRLVHKHETDTPLPSDPSKYYEQWPGWCDFLGQFNADAFKDSYKSELQKLIFTSGTEKYRKAKRGAGFLI